MNFRRVRFYFNVAPSVRSGPRLVNEFAVPVRQLCVRFDEFSTPVVALGASVGGLEARSCTFARCRNGSPERCRTATRDLTTIRSPGTPAGPHPSWDDRRNGGGGASLSGGAGSTIFQRLQTIHALKHATLTLMKVLTLIALLTIGLLCSAQDTPLAAPKWKKLHLTPEFWAEGACVGDVNRDGSNDILCGPFWYEGPRFEKRHSIYPATAVFAAPGAGAQEKIIRGFRGFLSGQNGYSDNFLSFTSDFNGDGWTDYLVVGHPGNETFWYENPQGKIGQPWQKHLALSKTDNESPKFVDVTGDGFRELICMSQGTLGFARPDPKNPTAPWRWHAVARNAVWQWNTHGLGYGDVNGDGRVDLLTAHNWWEQPESLDGDPLWKKHDAIFNNGGSQMFAYAVDGDGLYDVITAYEGHGYGVYWHKQLKDGSGAITWQRFRITGAPGEESHTGVVFSQPHALDLADMNGDGLVDEITGKRFWAHGPSGMWSPMLRRCNIGLS